MVGGCLAGAASFLLVPFFANAPMLVFSSLVFGVFVGFTQPVIMVWMFNNAPPGRSGEVVGLRQAVNNFMRVIGPAAFGLTVRALGLLPLFLGSSVLLVVAAYLSRPRRKR
mgnify:CR=1 FL=1